MKGLIVMNVSILDSRSPARWNQQLTKKMTASYFQKNFYANLKERKK